VTVLLPFVVLIMSFGMGAAFTLVQEGVGGHSVLEVGAVHVIM
jgi:hypothetical protein